MEYLHDLEVDNNFLYYNILKEQTLRRKSDRCYNNKIKSHHTQSQQIWVTDWE